MKKFLSLTISSLFLLLAFNSFAQDKKAMASPAAQATGTFGAAKVTINYHQPAVKGRTIWGSLVPYGKVWRTGANNATTIVLDKDVKIEGQTLKAGKYAIFTIPTETEWTIIFNKNAEQWGAYQYSEKDDVLRVKVKSTKAAAFTERLTFEVKEKTVQFSWENLTVAFKVE